MSQEQYVTVTPTWLGRDWKKGDCAPLAAFGARGAQLLLTGDLRPATPAEEAKAKALGATHVAAEERPPTDAEYVWQGLERAAQLLDRARETLAELRHVARRVVAEPARPGAPGWVPADLAAEQARVIDELQKKLAAFEPDRTMTPASAKPSRAKANA